jgi:hypothetical protein
MKKATIAATLAASMMSSLTAFAAGSYIYSWGFISRLETFGDDVIVHGLGFSPNPAACSDPFAARLQPSLTAAKKEGLVRMLTVAYSAGRQVRVELSSTECNGSNPAIYGVEIR